MFWSFWHVEIAWMHKYRFRPTSIGVRYVLYMFKTCIKAIAYTSNQYRCFSMCIWVDLGQNVHDKFNEFYEIWEKYTFFDWHIRDENSFRPSLKTLLKFTFDVEIASMDHLGHQGLSLSLVTSIWYGLNAIWKWRTSPAFHEKLKFNKFFMKKCYKQKELTFCI